MDRNEFWRKIRIFNSSNYHFRIASKTMKLIIIATILFILPLQVIGQPSDSLAMSVISKNAPKLFSNSRFPDVRDSSEGWNYYKEENGRYPFLCSADFNGDGKTDYAFLLIAKNSKKKYGIFCLLSMRKDHYKLIMLQETKGTPTDFGLACVSPGHYETAAGKGYGKPQLSEPLSIDLKYSAIDCFYFESSNYFFIWNSKSNRFDKIWMSD
jgi:hypothetical protein